MLRQPGNLFPSYILSRLTSNSIPLPFLAAPFRTVPSRDASNHSTSSKTKAGYKKDLNSDYPGKSLEKKEYEIASAVFQTSVAEFEQLPFPRFPEFAFIGHSNVGKSSLINFLTGQPELAHVSKQPGRTRTLNYFNINKSLNFVDCPGYGYARISKEKRHEWHELTQRYFLERKNLAHVYLLIDSAITPQQIDLDCALWLHEEKVRFSLIYTKADRPLPNHPDPAANVSTFMHALRTLTKGKTNAQQFITSSILKYGREELLRHIAAERLAFDMPVLFK